jgi:hypothetical protein
MGTNVDTDVVRQAAAKRAFDANGPFEVVGERYRAPISRPQLRKMFHGEHFVGSKQYIYKHAYFRPKLRQQKS